MIRKKKPAWRRSLQASGLIYGLGLVVVAIATWFTFQFVEPAPPKSLSIASGSTDGAYYRFALQLREQLAVHDVDLNVLVTEGSVDNLEQLSSGGVDVAFIQSGLAKSEDYPDFESLGAMYYEPLWIFGRKERAAPLLLDLKGKVVAAGGKGSGTRRVAQRLLENNALSEADVTLSLQAGNEAIEALRAGDVDAIMSVSSISSPLVETLLSDPSILLENISRAPAYARREPWLTHLILPEGVIDLAQNLPNTSVNLLSVNATLVGTESLHPALRDLLLLAADTIFSEATLLSDAEQFPSAQGSDFPVSAQAKRYHEHGAPFLQRYLPFWVANLVDRLKLLALPLIALLLPLSRMLPPAYRWTIRKKVYRWYEEVQDLDQAAHEDGVGADELQFCWNELRRIESDVRRVEVPLGYAYELYALRLHVDLVKGQVGKLLL